MKKKENEINACNAFIEILQRIKGVEYYPERWPEKENRNIPDVEVILAPKDKNGQLPKIAVEHTIIEAHDKQIAYVNQSYDYGAPQTISSVDTDDLLIQRLIISSVDGRSEYLTLLIYTFAIAFSGI